MAQESTQYPFIGSNGAERGGFMENPAVSSNHFLAPTATFTNFAALTNMSGAGYLKAKLAGTVYRIPLLTNA